MILFADIDGVMHAGLGEDEEASSRDCRSSGSFCARGQRSGCGLSQLMAGDFDARRACSSICSGERRRI